MNNDYDTDIEKGMNPLHKKSDDHIEETDNLRPKPKGIIVNNRPGSYENWFVDTIIRTGCFVLVSFLLVPLIVFGLYFSVSNYKCETHLIGINWLLLCCAIKTLIAYLIIALRLYSESNISEISELTIRRLKIITNFHIFYEVFYNTFIIYSISSFNMSNCDMAPFVYLIIYLVINYFGIFLYFLSKFKN